MTILLPSSSWQMRMIPYRQSPEPPVLVCLTQELADLELYHRYKIGDAFFHLPLSQAQEMLEASTTKMDEEISELEETLGTIKEEMQQLKVQLYARFGKSINLDL